MILASGVRLDTCDAKMEDKHNQAEDQHQQTYTELLHGLGEYCFLTLCQSGLLSISGDPPLLFCLNFAALYELIE